MSDPITKPHTRDDKVYGPSSTNVNIKPPSNGGGIPVIRPPQFDIINNTSTANGQKDHQSCSANSMNQTNGFDEYTSLENLGEYGISGHVTKFKRRKRKRETYCI